MKLVFFLAFFQLVSSNLHLAHADIEKLRAADEKIARSWCLDKANSNEVRTVELNEKLGKLGQVELSQVRELLVPEGDQNAICLFIVARHLGRTTKRLIWADLIDKSFDMPKVRARIHRGKIEVRPSLPPDRDSDPDKVHVLTYSFDPKSLTSKKIKDRVLLEKTGQAD